jgi:hypothetical protein
MFLAIIVATMSFNKNTPGGITNASQIGLSCFRLAPHRASGDQRSYDYSDLDNLFQSSVTAMYVLMSGASTTTSRSFGPIALMWSLPAWLWKAALLSHFSMKVKSVGSSLF